MKDKHLYRYILEHFDGRCNIRLESYLVVKTTPKGYWIQISYGRKKWVSNYGRSRYAQESELEALKHYIRRKTYRNHCIMDEMMRNDTTIIKAKNILKKLKNEQK